jgi:ABC-type transport system involved in multi-copper enzyme maturation permease subunit
MTHTLAVARRDLSERTPVFVTAAAIAVMPFVLTLVRGLRGINRLDIITTIGTVGAVGFSLALAFILGVSMISRDLMEKRMSFYLSKPLSARAIWFGKVIAALLTITFCFVVIFVPSYLFGTTSWQRSWNVDLAGGLTAVGAAALLLLFLGHVFGTMFRSKSPLIALDLVLLGATVLAVIGIIRPLLDGFAGDLTKRVALTLFGALMLILLACGAWQLEKGRSDRRQNHVALSRFLWTALAIVLAIGGAFTWWVVHPAPSDLIEPEVSQPGQGSWSFVFGRANNRMDYHALFAYDLATGESLRINGIRSWFSSGFLHDGSTVAYLKLPDYHAGEGELYLQPLRAGAQPQPTQITMTRNSEFTFSDDGLRIGVIDVNGIVTAYELASKKALVSAKLPQAERVRRRLFFVKPDLLRIYIQTPQYPSVKPVASSIEIYELDVRTRALAHTGSYHAETRALGLTVSGDGSRGLIIERDDNENVKSQAFVIDARTAQVIAPAPAASLTHVTLLADGSVAVLLNEANGWTLDLHAIDGTAHRIPIGRMTQLNFARELSGGMLVLSGVEKKDSTMFVVDYAHGSVVRREPDLRSGSFYGYQQWYGADPRRSIADASQAMVVHDDAKALYAWQPLTGAKKKLL